MGRVRRKRINWKDDAVGENGKSSDDVVTDWLVMDGNFSRWKAGKARSGETKESLCTEILVLLQQQGITHRTNLDIRGRLYAIEKSYETARDWLVQNAITNQIVDSEERQAKLAKLCPQYAKLAPVFDRVYVEMDQEGDHLRKSGRKGRKSLSILVNDAMSEASTDSYSAAALQSPQHQLGNDRHESIPEVIDVDGSPTDEAEAEEDMENTPAPAADSVAAVVEQDTMTSPPKRKPYTRRRRRTKATTKPNRVTTIKQDNIVTPTSQPASTKWEPRSSSGQVESTTKHDELHADPTVLKRQRTPEELHAIALEYEVETKRIRAAVEFGIGLKQLMDAGYSATEAREIIARH